MLINQARFARSFRFTPSCSLWSKLVHNTLQSRSQCRTAHRGLPVITVLPTRCATARRGPPVQEVLSGDEPKPSALALSQPFRMPIVRLKIVARQNYPFSKLTAGKVIDRPVHPLLTDLRKMYGNSSTFDTRCSIYRARVVNESVRRRCFRRSVPSGLRSSGRD